MHNITDAVQLLCVGVYVVHPALFFVAFAAATFVHTSGVLLNPQFQY